MGSSEQHSTSSSSPSTATGSHQHVPSRPACSSSSAENRATTPVVVCGYKIVHTTCIPVLVETELLNHSPCLHSSRHVSSEDAVRFAISTPTAFMLS